MLNFANNEIVGLFEKRIVPILPYHSTPRMNYQSPQAMRIFYGRNLEKVPLRENRCDGHIVKRPIYGPLSVITTTGQHPVNGFKVFPFTPELEQIQADLAQEVRRHLPRERWKNVDLDFNFLEIKVYLGRDVFCDAESGAPITVGSGKHGKPLRTDCNKSVGLHSDLSFSDAGIQDPRDTANGNHPTATFTIGSERHLTFVPMTKSTGNRSVEFETDATHRTRRGRQVRAPCAHVGTPRTFMPRGEGGIQNDRWRRKWKHCPEHGNVVHRLRDGSIFVLLPEDEIPTRKQDTLHKAKHRADFRGTGVSMAFVFRSVTQESFFSSDTDGWLPHRDEKYRPSVERYLNRTERKYASILDDAGDDADAIARIKANIKAFMKTL